MNIKRLKERSAAETTFSGFGLWDVFTKDKQYLGTIAMSQNDPSFVIGDDYNYDYAPGYLIFAHGLVRR